MSRSRQKEEVTPKQYQFEGDGTDRAHRKSDKREGKLEACALLEMVLLQ